MRKFLAFIVLAVPFISFAQTGPQMQISNLQTGEVSYHAGQEITGSFVLNNIGDENIPDIQYYVAVGNYGDVIGGPLENEASVTPLSESIYLPKAARLEVPFSITPTNLPAGELGIQITAAQKNGLVLGQRKIPLKFEGERTDNSKIIEGYYVLDGEQYDLRSNPPFDENEIPSFTLLLPEGMEDGTKEIKLTIYDKHVGQEVVSDQTIAVDFVDGVGQILLPENLKPKTYAGQVSLVEGSSVLALAFSIAGPQAEILGVDTDLLSVKKGQDFVVSLNYADTPLNARDPEATEYPENLSVRIKILNEKGDIVTEHQQALETTKKVDLLEVDENSTEEEQAEATARLEKMLNNERILDIPVTADARAKSLSFEVELFDAVTGEVYDTYKTAFPPAANEYPARGILLATLAAVLILLVIIFKTAKHKIPMVCLALILGSVVSGYVLVQDAEARKALEVKGFANSHVFTFNNPTSSLTDGYDVGTAIPVDLTVSSKAWGSNGFLAHYVRYPLYTSTWAPFSTASAALNNAQTYHKNESVYNVTRKNSTFQKSLNVLYMYNANGSSAQAPNLSPGMHYLPVSSTYCTASHGCSGASFVVWEICVNGIGVCPGETQTADACPYMNGVLNPAVQTSVPSGYVKVGNDCRNNCSVNMGQTCGCSNEGTVQCDGSCSVSTSCSTFNVSCSASPSSLTEPGTVTFTASSNDASGPVTYTWPDGSHGLTYQKTVTGSGQLVYLDATDGTNTAEGSCAAGYTNTSCVEAEKPNECSVCRSDGEWDATTCTNTDVAASFSFQPNIVASGGSCRLQLTASNVTSCQLVKTATLSSDPDWKVDAPEGATTITSTNDVTVPVGTYRLECIGSDEGDVNYEAVSGVQDRQCIAAPVIIEN
jgi:hypothetical protein